MINMGHFYCMHWNQATTYSAIKLTVFLFLTLTLKPVNGQVSGEACYAGWPIQDRGGPDGSGFTMVSPDQTFDCSGEITMWRYQGKQSNPFRAIVFRPVGLNQLEIVGINDIPAGAINQEVAYPIPEGKRIEVKAGDMIGWSFDSSVLTYNQGGTFDVRWLGGNLHASLAVGQTPTFTGNGNREYSIEASVKTFDSTIEFSDSQYFVLEGETVKVHVTRRGTFGSSTGAVEVSLASTTDIEFPPSGTGTASFSTTATQVQVSIKGKEDAKVEGIECVGITLALAAGTTLTDSLGDRTTAEVCVIDTSSIFWIDSVYVGVESSSVDVIIHREGYYGRSTDVVDITLAHGTTMAGDYTAPSGTVYFASNVPTAKVTIPLTDDSSEEGLEQFTVSIGVNHAATALVASVDTSAMSATVSIFDNISNCVRFRSYLQIVKENGRATICLQREGNVAESGRIVINTEDVDATVDLDYTPIPTADRTVTFLAEETQVCMDIEVKYDLLKEDTECFKVSLSELTGGDAIPRCSDESAQVLIKDDDDEFNFEGITYKVKESTGQVEIVITRHGYLGRTSSICVSTQSGDDPRLDAQEKVDYEHISNKQIDFDINQKSEVLLINIEEDNVGEDEEHFTVMLETCSSNPNVHGQQIGFPRKTTVLISNTFTCTDPCVNGECTAENTCGCNDGYSGVVCDIPVCDVCDNGECIGINTCQCVTGWIGNGCDIPSISGCPENYCFNGGLCIETGTSYYCRCPRGFSGDQCLTVTQVEQDEEENVPDVREDTAGMSDGAFLAAIIIGAIGGVASLALLGILAFRVISRQSKLPQQPNPPEALRMDLLPYNGLNPAYGVYNNVTGSGVLY